LFWAAFAQTPAAIEIDLGNHEQVRRAIELPNVNLIFLVNEAINADAYFPYIVNAKLVKISPTGSVLATQFIGGTIFQEMKRIGNNLFLIGSDPFSGGAFNARKYDLNFNLIAQGSFKQNGKLFVSRDISQVVLDSVFQNILIVDSLNQSVCSIGVLKLDTNLNHRLIQLPNTVVGASKVGFNPNSGKLYNLQLENILGILASNRHEVDFQFTSVEIDELFYTLAADIIRIIHPVHHLMTTS